LVRFGAKYRWGKLKEAKKTRNNRAASFSLKIKLIFFQLLQPEELVDRSDEDKGSDAKTSNKIEQTNFRQFEVGKNIIKAS